MFMGARSFTSEELVGRFEDQRDLRNIVGKISYCCVLKREKDIFPLFWSTRDDVCLGVNEGWYEGPEAVSGYFDAFHARTVYTTAFLKKRYPKQLGDKTDEEAYGVAMMNIKPVDTAVIEVAADGATAKGVWYVRGSNNELTTSGPVAFWTFGCFAVDFVRENGAWKIWHMQYLEDLSAPGGKDWGKKEPESYPPMEGYEDVEPFVKPAPTKPVQLRARYTPDRPFSVLVEPPVPYATFAETFSYGL
jgi:hypothetical protein